MISIPTEGGWVRRKDGRRPPLEKVKQPTNQLIEMEESSHGKIITNLYPQFPQHHSD